MSKLYLPTGHPAIEILRSEGIEVCDSAVLEQQRTQDAAKPPLRIALINLMPDPDHPVGDFGRLLAQYPDRDIQILDFSPTPEKISKDADTIAKRSSLLPLNTIADYDLDGAILSGFGKEDMNFKNVWFWEELTGALDVLKEKKIPTLASCWGAQAALYYHHGIEKTWDATNKVLGVFEQQISEPNHPLLKGVNPENPFPMPVSRIGKCNETQILANPNLTVLATNEYTGASIVAANHLTCITGHPEYGKDSIPDEDKRDIKRSAPHLNGEPDKYIPVNVYIDNDRTKAALPAQWPAPGQALINNWVTSVDQYSREVKPKITNCAERPTSAHGPKPAALTM